MTTRATRGSDHALVQRISHVAYGDDTQDQSLATCVPRAPNGWAESELCGLEPDS